MSREIFYKIVPVDESEIAEALNELEPDYNWRNNGLYKTLILGNFFFFLIKFLFIFKSVIAA